jgi:DNA-binding transcriptional LysR family regulator
VTLADGFPDDLIERMQGSQIDVSFVGTTVTNPERMVIDLLLEEPMVAALPRRHLLAKGRPDRDPGLPLKALSDDTFIVFGPAQNALTVQSNAVIAACQAAGFTPRVGYATANNLSRLNLVAAGLGVSVVAASVQRINIEGVVYRRLKGAGHLKVPLNLASRRGEASAVVRQFRAVAKRTARNFRADEGRSS